MSKKTSLNQLRWQARRGMWELDLLLIPFIESKFLQLSWQQQQVFAQLLTAEDQDLLAWLLTGTICPNGNFHAIISQIRTFARQSNSINFRPV